MSYAEAVKHSAEQTPEEKAAPPVPTIQATDADAPNKFPGDSTSHVQVVPNDYTEEDVLRTSTTAGPASGSESTEKKRSKQSAITEKVKAYFGVVTGKASAFATSVRSEPVAYGTLAFDVACLGGLAAFVAKKAQAQRLSWQVAGTAALGALLAAGTHATITYVAKSKRK